LGKDLTRWRLPNDGFMDEVHSNRTLFDADMCALLINDSGGLARISLDYNQTFSVTGADNFNIFTFHHELGHNMLCLHDLINTDQPGTAPYAGYGEPNNSCFRTIMAYQEACGSAFGCDRVNVFSRSIGTFNCNGIDYAKGGVNNRNRDRLVLSKDVINNHTTVFTNITYGGDYNWRNDESVNFVAEETVGYESTTDNRWDMFNGSTGSFRASEEITLGEGFWARTGSTFSAYLESCEDITGNAAEDPTFDLIVTNANTNQSTAKDNTKYVHNLSVFPNPFRESTNVIFELDENTHSVTISVKDLLGKEVIQITHVVELNAGQHVIEVQTADLPNGIYLLTLQAGEEVMVERIIKGN
ncbi:MAG: zinc-dependent metalloprotease, partial [Bacteroidota bacterium]